MRKPDLSRTVYFLSHVFFVSLLASLVLVGCSDDGGDDSSDTEDTMDFVGNDTTSPCAGIDECESARIVCEDNTLVECVFGADGCLDEIRTDCAGQGEVCQATATRASCQPDPGVCDTLPNACGVAGSRCDGETLIECAPNDDGCLVATETNCADNSRVCSDGGDGTAFCVEAPCADVANPCSSEGVSCQGSELVTCARNDDNCLEETRTNCADNGEVCDDSSGTAMCATSCQDHPDCVGAMEGDMTCMGPAIQECVSNQDGCLEPSIVDCAAGEYCDDSSGTATCTQTCSSVAQRLSCADAGSPVVLNTTNGSADFDTNDCTSSSNYSANELLFEFVDPGESQVTITATFGSGDYDLFAFEGMMGMCTETNTCIDSSQNVGGTEVVSFDTAPGQLTYIMVDRFGAGMEEEITVDVVCEVCGDGVPGSGEACDDGNLMPGDGCSDTCEVEFGYECDNSTSPSTCTMLPDIGTFAATDMIPDTMGGAVPLGESESYQITFTEEVLVTGLVEAGTTGDPDLYVLGPEGLVTVSGFDGDEIFEIGLLPGTYEFVVVAYDQAADPLDSFTLSLTSDPLNATDLGSFAPTDAISDQMGGPITAGSSDWYTITFSAPVLLSGSTMGTTTGDVDVFLYDAASQKLAAEAIGLENFTDVEIPAGTYILQVYAFLDDATVDTYTLSLSTLAVP